MKLVPDVSIRGYLLYVHILPGHFEKNARALYGPETFSFVVNQSRPIPDIDSVLQFAHYGTLRAARVVSLCATNTHHIARNITTYDHTVHSTPVADTTITVATMKVLLHRRGWKFLTRHGTIDAYH